MSAEFGQLTPEDSEIIGESVARTRVWVSSIAEWVKLKHYDAPWPYTDWRNYVRGQVLEAEMAEAPPSLEEVARHARLLIAHAEHAGVVIDDGNVVDLIADDLTEVSLSDIRAALVVAGLAARFPKSTRAHA